jgi:hypothetical protein
MAEQKRLAAVQKRQNAEQRIELADQKIKRLDQNIQMLDQKMEQADQKIEKGMQKLEEIAEKKRIMIVKAFCSIFNLKLDPTGEKANALFNMYLKRSHRHYFRKNWSPLKESNYNY